MQIFEKFKILVFVFSILNLLTTNANSTEECFEGTSRAVFKFNMALDDVILEPIAKGYNKLPSPIKSGATILPLNIELCYLSQIICYKTLSS